MNHLLRLSAGLLLAISPRQAAAQAPVRFELPNGLRVWVQEDHTRPVALVQVAYKVGAINEEPGKTGTAHYVEHMVYRATEHIRNEDNYGYNDRIGGRWTGGTSRDGTTYGETVPSWALDAALRITAERMGRTVFDSVEFERERNNVVTEANGFSRSDPATALRDAVMLASFEIHPYRYSSTTWSQDNLAISRNDARDYYRRYYGPNNAVLTIVGDVAPAEVRRLVTLHFGTLARAPRSGAVSVTEPPQRAEKRLNLRAASDRAQMEVVYRAPGASHRDYAVLAVLDRILTHRLRASLPAGPGADLVTTHAATPYPFVYRIAATAGGEADLERLLATIQAEIERLATGGVSDTELAAARVEPAPQGRGRGNAGAGEAQGGTVPPRQSNLTQIAAQLTNREVFPWEIGADDREAIRRAQTTVTSADIAAYVDRWLRVSQRTVGFLVPGPDDFMPSWSNGRALVGQRLEVPPLTTPPAKRARPEPVPLRALQPLGKLTIEPRRATLANGVVVQVAQMSGPTTTLALRIAFGNERDPAGKEGLALLAARLVASDLALQALSARATTTTLANDGYFDIRVSGTPATAASMLEAAARALRARDFTQAQVNAEAVRPVRAATGGRGGGRGAGVTAEARARVLGVVAPSWVATDPTPVATLTARDVNDYLAQHVGGAAVTVALVGPASAAELNQAVSRAFTSFPSGSRAPHASVGRAAPSVAAAQEERIAVATETQVTVLAGLPGVARDDPDARALELLNYIVGVPSYGGRLGWALTKVGLTYSSAATTTSGASTGHILISTKCDTRNLDATIQAIREVIAGVGENGVALWELREAQSFTLGRTLLYGPREDSGQDAIGTALLDSESGGTELLDLPALSRAYLAVTLQQVNAAARRYYRSDLLKIAAIGAVPTGEAPRIFPPGTFRALFQR